MPSCANAKRPSAAARRSKKTVAPPPRHRMSRANSNRVGQTQDSNHMKRRVVNSFVLFDVVYTDGSRSSNRKIPRSVVDSLDGPDAIKAAIEAQDRDIALASGRAQADVKSVTRSRT